MRWQDYTNDPALTLFVALRAHGARILARRGYEDFALHLATGAPAASAESVAGGRQAHPVVELPSAERVVVRRYRRGGFVRHFNRERYFGGHRACDELRATERARLAGVRAPQIVAAVERPGALGYTALLASILIPGAATLDAWLPSADPRDRVHVLGEVGRQIGWMHAAGVAHPDLNLRNLLVSGERDEEDRPRVYLIDFDRARVFEGEVPPARRERDLRRLERSARKLGADISEEDWTLLRGGYRASHTGT